MTRHGNRTPTCTVQVAGTDFPIQITSYLVDDFGILLSSSQLLFEFYRPLASKILHSLIVHISDTFARRNLECSTLRAALVVHVCVEIVVNPCFASFCKAVLCLVVAVAKVLSISINMLQQEKMRLKEESWSN